MKTFRFIVIVCFTMFSFLYINNSEGSEKPKRFDPQINKLPQKYLGNNLNAFFNFYNKKKFHKDEFETTEAYKNRIQNFLKDDIFAFRPMHKDVKYSADSEELQISIGASHTSSNTRVYGLSSVALNETQKTVGKTLLGQDKEYAAIYKMLVTNNSYKDSYGVSVSLKMPALDAKKLKKNIEVLLICKVDLPFIYDEPLDYASDGVIYTEEDYYSNAFVFRIYEQYCPVKKV